jgi:hypothetical protein
MSVATDTKLKVELTCVENEIELSNIHPIVGHQDPREE